MQIKGKVGALPLVQRWSMEVNASEKLKASKAVAEPHEANLEEVMSNFAEMYPESELVLWFLWWVLPL